MSIEERRVIKYAQVRSGPAEEGREIGYAGAGLEIRVDTDLQHDRWIVIHDPLPLWANRLHPDEDYVWIKESNTQKEVPNQKQYLLTLDVDDNIVSCVRVK